MINKNLSIRKNYDYVFRCTLMLFGIFLCAIGINAFLTPANLLSGGVAGIGVILHHIFDINQGVSTFIINIPIFIVGIKYLDKDFLIISFVNMFLFSFALGVTQDLYRYVQLNDPMIQCIYGGLLNGTGMGLIFKSRACVGGLDIIAAALKKQFNIEMKNTFVTVNLFVVSVGGILFGFRLALYTLIAMYLASHTMAIVKDSFNSQKSIMVVSDYDEEIANCIMNKLKRGVTYLEAEGAYTHHKKKLLYCIVKTSEIAKFKELVYSIDDKALICINDVNEVKGGGFKGKFL
ncbi:YitT family protein [[Clostridium] dakarense]|uniref:YitT family protein n=1 Tax=Faecalimicrobium dakarense TaxID=1301100 RepID=UPI0004BC760F|nr:YitT family protein [[Clostridium] dakarense]